MKPTLLTVRSLILPALMAALLALQGCTCNNGDIGRWFGTWTVEQILTDGEPYAAYEHNMVWKFQNSVFSMQLINPDPGIHDRQQRWGSWSETDGELILDFSHSDNIDAPGEGIYAPFAVSLLNRGGISALRITESKGNRLTLGFTSAAGIKVTYIINKQ